MSGMKTTRRDFLKISGAAGGGLLIGLNLYSCKSEPDWPDFEQEINAYIRVNGDGTVTILGKNPEIGQGVKTSLPMILAEELDMPWEKVTVETAKYDNVFGAQYAGGSNSVRTNYETLRQAGAIARDVLVRAAAKQWQVKEEDCKTEDGFIINGKNKVHYGQVALEAAKLELKEEVPLKDPKDFKLIGKSTKEVDLEKIVTGQPLFGIDQEVEGMVYATVVKPEVFGAKVVNFDGAKALEQKGVLDVFKIDGHDNPLWLQDGVAVVAENIWTAFKAKKLVEVKWKNPENYVESTDELYSQFREGIAKKGKEIRIDGNPDQAVASADQVIEGTFQVPFLSHAQMEPMNFIADVREDKIHLTGSTQTPGAANYYASELTGIPRENITVDFTRIGGGFGRRLLNDYSNEAVMISQKIKRPVKLVWDRENDFLGDYYRPAGAYKFTGALKNGKLDSLEINVSSTSRYAYRQEPEDEHHASEVFEDQQPARLIPNLRVTYFKVNSHVPVGALRTPGVNATTFAYQSFLDELATAAGRDPIDFQLEILGDGDKEVKYDNHGGPTYSTGKLKNVINLVRERSGWDSFNKSDRALGFAGQMVFGTYVAEIVEVGMQDGKLKIYNVWAVADAGRIINPAGAYKQVQGGITDGISAALYEGLEIKNGKPVQRNFDTYRKLRMPDSPPVDVYLVESSDPPQGLGEPSYPVIFPALANAVSKLTGARVRELPLSKSVNV